MACLAATCLKHESWMKLNTLGHVSACMCLWPCAIDLAQLYMLEICPLISPFLSFSWGIDQGLNGGQPPELGIPKPGVAM